MALLRKLHSAVLLPDVTPSHLGIAMFNAHKAKLLCERCREDVTWVTQAVLLNRCLVCYEPVTPMHARVVVATLVKLCAVVLAQTCSKRPAAAAATVLVQVPICFTRLAYTVLQDPLCL
jgi:hypothetical protein